MSQFPPLSVKVEGDWACFTRPESKVERVSYPVMTPSAARGILEAIFWKPEIHWRILSIAVLKPIQFAPIVRNEVNRKIPLKPPLRPYFADRDRAQRSTLALRDVSYVITADFFLASHASSEHIAKFRDQFRRRVAKGQCYRQPYLGCREFTTFFSPPDHDKPIHLNLHIGRMLFDIRYLSDHSGRGEPIFFDASLQNGILYVPQEPYREIYGGEL